MKGTEMTKASKKTLFHLVLLLVGMPAAVFAASVAIRAFHWLWVGPVLLGSLFCYGAWFLLTYGFYKKIPRA
jgi:hypothetical protein